MNPNKSCGPDDVHPRMLQELVNIISDPITILLKKTIDCGKIPADWRRANVTPIYKKGVKNLAENYRPISLTSLICKLIESLINGAIMKHHAELKFLSLKQFGFISGRSTTTQLMRCFDNCLDAIVDGNVVDTVYLDFAKAFDSVPPHGLLGKPISYGVT